jgi:hypothetical protein
MRDFIGKQVHRVNRNYLLATLLLLIVPAVAASLSYRWAYNVLAGPFPIRASELEQVQGPDGMLQNYFRVQEDLPALDTGARAGTQKAGMTKKWLLLPVGQRLLLVEAPIGQEGTEHVGYLAPIRADADKDLINQLSARAPGLKDTLLPYKLNGVYGYRGQFLALACLVAPVFLGALWVFGLFLVRAFVPSRHPVLRALVPYGDPEEVRQQIDADFEGATLRIGRLQLTRDWLLGVKLWGLDVARVEDVVWAYKLVVRGEGASISAIICTRQGANFGIQGKDKDVGAMLKVIAECVPWALVGYDPGLEKLWNSGPQQVAAIVEERRRRFQAAAPENGPDPEGSPPGEPGGPADSAGSGPG